MFLFFRIGARLSVRVRSTHAIRRRTLLDERDPQPHGGCTERPAVVHVDLVGALGLTQA